MKEIKEKIYRAEQGERVLQRVWGEKATYICYYANLAQWYFETDYLWNGHEITDVKLIDRETAVFSLT